MFSLKKHNHLHRVKKNSSTIASIFQDTGESRMKLHIGQLDTGTRYQALFSEIAASTEQL